MTKNIKNNSGFTLIELLVVVAIIGILAAIAVPQFSAFRKRAYDSTAMSDLGNIRTAQEAYFADNEFYAANLSNLTGFEDLSSNVSLGLSINAQSWEGSTYHPNGLNTYCFDSSVSSNGSITTVAGLASACP